MSIDTTDRGHVALYDNTTGQVIGGPLFPDAEQAADFVAWAGDRLLGPNPDHYPPPLTLVTLQSEWAAERLDGNDCLKEAAHA